MGVILYELFCNRMLFNINLGSLPDMNDILKQQQAMTTDNNKPLQLPFPAYLNGHICDLIKKFVIYNPEKRYTT
eukprot:UN17575